MKKLAALFAGVSALTALAAPAQANVVIANGTVEAHTVDYIPFSYTGGAISIFTTGNPFGPNIQLLDPMIRLFVDDGSPFGALTGTLVGTADDDIGFDPLLGFGSLAAGNYILAVGAYDMTVAEARSGVASTPLVDEDYSTTFAGLGTITLGQSPAVPEPATWALLVGGFAFTGLVMRRSVTRVAFS